MTKLILLRHGQSAWNEQNLFTGWVDIPLSDLGIQESIRAGKKIRDLPIDIIYTSTLVRSHMTLAHVMLQHASRRVPVFLHPGQGNLEKWGTIYSEETRTKTVPVHSAWELNERMYGELQGLNKDEMRKKFGAEQVQIWRRSFDVAPPGGESLAMTTARAWPYFKKTILPHLIRGENVLIAAHGNSLRGIMMQLDHLTKEEVVKLELPTGEPILYQFEGERYERIALS
jgi:2,3-bisphosphoglycerate-dependent phosphoglycerate mutase